jgi:hypothetical protein
MLVRRKEEIAVRGTCYWITDRKAKVLVEYHNTKDEAVRSLAAREAEEKALDYYEPEFYKIIESDITKLMRKGYKLEFA